MPPKQILLIRHGEKPPKLGQPKGIKPDGTEDHHSLVVRGWQRAGALVPFFCAAMDRAIGCPTIVFSPPIDGKDGDHGRPYQTVIAIAARLGVPHVIDHSLDQEEALVADVRSRDGVVLIAWEHKRIAKIANAILGDQTTAPQKWPDDRFDLVWVFDLDPSGRYRFSQVPQLLLAGDRPDVVPSG
jgi:broad specificity phosphatase PhoE